MYPVQNYLEIAKKNEAIFRSILRDLRDNHSQRPGGLYVPEDLETEAPLESIFEKYSYGHRFGIFTITDFTVTTTALEKKALIAFEDVAVLSGGGARLKYKVSADSVEYHEPGCVFLS